EHVANATASSGGGSLVASISSLDANARDTGSANVRIGAASGGSATSVTTTAGGIDADANMSSTVRSDSEGLNFSLVAVGDIKTKAENASSVTGRIGDNVNVNVQGGDFDL